jgi:hypothetical protein
VTVTDFPDWMGTGQQVSTMIASGSVSGTPGGTPLLHGYTLITDNTTWSAAAASSYFSSRYQLPSPAYQFAIQITVANAAATIPFARVALSFLTAETGGVKVDEIDFYVCATSSGKYWIYGAGPAPTPFVQVQVQNFDPTYGMSGEYVLGSSTLQKTRHDWRCLPGGTVPGFTQPSIQNPNALILAGSPAAGTTVAADSLVTYLLPLYTGQVFLTASLSIVPNPAAIYEVQTPSGLTGAGVLTEIFLLSTTAQFITSEGFALPRSQCLLTFQNNNGVSAISYDWGLIALEYAS